MGKKVKARKEPEHEEIGEGDQLCSKCGSQMIWEEDKIICPNCDGEIDFFGDGDKEE